MARFALRYLGARAGAPLGNFTGRPFDLVPGAIIPVGETPVVLGRSPLVGLCIVSSVVAVRHGSVQVEGDGLRFHDFNTTNGTRVNDVSIRSALLHAGDRVTVSDAFDFDVVQID